MARFKEFLKAAPVAIGLPVVIGAASVKPEDAASNLSSWAKACGIHYLPSWVKSPAFDTQVIVIAIALSALYVFLVWIGPRIREAKMFFYAAIVFGSLFIVSIIGMFLTGDFTGSLSYGAHDASKASNEDDTSRPTLLDLFMTEFTGTFTGQTLVYDKQLVFKDGHSERFLISRFYDYVNNSNFMSFYIHTRGWEKIVTYIIKKNKNIAAEMPPVTYDAKMEGDNHVVKIEDTVFSGKIFVYIPELFDVEKIANIMKLARESGCFIEIRGFEYEELMKQNTRKYQGKIPPHYDMIKDNPVLVKSEINLNSSR